MAAPNKLLGVVARLDQNAAADGLDGQGDDLGIAVDQVDTLLTAVTGVVRIDQLDLCVNRDRLPNRHVQRLRL